MEVLIKSGMQIAQTDFSSDCMKTTQEYLMYFKEFSCNMTENMQARCVPRFIQCFLITKNGRRGYFSLDKSHKKYYNNLNGIVHDFSVIFLK